MRTLAEIAHALKAQLTRQGSTQESLGEAAGLSRQTLSKVLSGRADFKVTTLLALADRLGLEVLLVPKSIARSMQPEDSPRPTVRSRIQQVLDAVSRQQTPEKK